MSQRIIPTGATGMVGKAGYNIVHRTVANYRKEL